MPGLPIEFVLFALTLIGIAAVHRRTLQVALDGRASITLDKLHVYHFTITIKAPAAGGAGHAAGVLVFLTLRGSRLTDGWRSTRT